MIKNRTVQLIYQSAYCSIGLIGIVSSFGLFNYSFATDFYIYFTNFCNYFCFTIMLLSLTQTAKSDVNTHVCFSPALRFVGLLGITLILLVFNILIAPGREAYLNFRVNSILFHIVLPILYIGEWLLFSRPRSTKWYYPFLALIFPFTYAVYIVIRAEIIGPDSLRTDLYPYYFLNINAIGFIGFFRVCVMLTLIYSMVGYIFIGLNHLKIRK